jgi:hypothetical protein
MGVMRFVGVTLLKSTSVQCEDHVGVSLRSSDVVALHLQAAFQNLQISPPGISQQPGNISFIISQVHYSRF